MVVLEYIQPWIHAAGFYCELITMRHKYDLYFVVPHHICPSPKLTGGWSRGVCPSRGARGPAGSVPSISVSSRCS